MQVFEIDNKYRNMFLQVFYRMTVFGIAENS